MILYHFTFIHALKQAGPNNTDPVGDAPAVWSWTGGLRPGPKSMEEWSDGDFDPPPGVWLTNDPTHGDAVRKVMADGQQIKYEIRLTVAIPLNSARLVHWVSYLKKHRGDEWWFTRAFTEAQLATVETFYCYFGTVGQSNIRSIDLLLRPAQPTRRQSISIDPAGYRPATS